MVLRRSCRVTAVAVLVVFMVVGAGQAAAAAGPAASIYSVISVDGSGILGNGASDQPVLSANGRFLAFVSTASNLVPNDTNQVADVFVKDLQTGATQRVSVSTAGVQANDAVEGFPGVSATGRFVAFASAASNLVPNDSNTRSDVFVRDLALQTTVRVSVSSTGVEGNAASGQPMVSGDGKIVAFMSNASNLAPGDLNAAPDVFVRNLRTSGTTLVSASSAGVRGNAASSDPSITGDGRYVTYTSRASNLVPGDTNLASDVFLYDRATLTTSLVSVDATGGPANGASANAEISSNGTWIAFDSYATDLVATDTNNHRDIFRRDHTTSVTELISRAPYTSLVQTNGHSFAPSISTDGLVTFATDATNLANADTNGVTDVALFQRTGSYLVSSPDGSTFVGGWAPTISETTMVFTSNSPDLAPNDTNNAPDVFNLDPDPLPCTSGSGGQVECDLTSSGDPVPTTVQWYIDGVHDPSLDNRTIVQLTLNCQPNTRGHIHAVTTGGTGIGAAGYRYDCYP
jgi:hypothetical protein